MNTGVSILFIIMFIFGTLVFEVFNFLKLVFLDYRCFLNVLGFDIVEFLSIEEVEPIILMLALR